MRHLLFNRNNPPPQTLWQRRRAWAMRTLRGLWRQGVETYQDCRTLLGAEPVTGIMLLGFLLRDQLHQAPAEPGEPAKAWINFVIQIAIVVVAAVVAIAMAPKPPIPKPAALSDFDVPTAEECRPIAKVFGTVLIRDPNNLWYGDLSSEPIKKKGGKK